KAGDVGHVHHEQRADIPANLREGFKVDFTRVSAGTGDDELRLVLAGQSCDLVEVDALIAALDSIAGDVEILAGEIQPHPVRQVPAVRQVHRQDGIARL